MLRVYDAVGAHAHDIEVPRHYSLADANRKSEGIEGREGSDLMQFGLTSFAETGSLWSHNLAAGETELIRPSAGLIDPARYLVEQVRVTSDDGTRVPLFLTRRDDIGRPATCATLLYGYGGFDIAIDPGLQA